MKLTGIQWAGTQAKDGACRLFLTTEQGRLELAMSSDVAERIADSLKAQVIISTYATLLARVADRPATHKARAPRQKSARPGTLAA